MICISTNKLPLLLTMFLFYFSKTKAEVFTSVDDMADLLDTQSVVIGKLNYYINEQEERLGLLKQRVNQFIKQYDEAYFNVSGFIRNPINAFILSKRMSGDLYEINHLMKDTIIDILNPVNEDGSVLKFATNEDLSGSSIAIVRIQDTYDLNTTDIANGKLPGVDDSRTVLSASDCFQIGYHAYVDRQYKYAISWLTEALNRYQNVSSYLSLTSKTDILGYLAAAHNDEGNTADALRYTIQLLANDPQNEVALNNKIVLEKKLVDEQENPKEKKEESEEIGEITDEVRRNLSWMKIYDSNQKKIYKELCRKERFPTPKQLAPLRCRYVTNKSAFLKIAPFKLEENSLDPYIVTYHGVLSDKEIDTLKELAKSKLSRAAVVSSKEIGVNKPADYRISKFAWMKDDVHKYVEDIGRRVQDISSLTVATAEELQVLNYGIGGHYEPHFDFASPVDYSLNPRGIDNRIATMSDVEEGGATVFPFINLSLWPQKGSAAFWYNLYTSGEGDYRTKHAGCPVIVGSKWVCNKWLHVRGQEKLRPCSLIPDHPNDTF